MTNIPIIFFTRSLVSVNKNLFLRLLTEPLIGVYSLLTRDEEHPSQVTVGTRFPRDPVSTRDSPESNGESLSE